MEIQHRPTYPVLEAEIARKGLKKCDVARIAGIKSSTLSRKLSGMTEFSLPEGLKIWVTLFPEMNILELFSFENDAKEEV